MKIENSKNPRNKTTGYKGIRKTKNGTFDAVLTIKMPNGQNSPLVQKTRYIGNYKTLEEAKQARKEFIMLLL